LTISAIFLYLHTVLCYITGSFVPLWTNFDLWKQL